MTNESDRTDAFTKNQGLEGLLAEINGLLEPASHELRRHARENHGKLLVVGPHRSGSTLFMQWLASTSLVAYPTNLLSRFYGAPLVGAKIQQLLTDPRYNFRDEILDFTSPIDFTSDNGKTRGALAPNEFWYFWRRFLPFDTLDYLPDDALRAEGDLAGLRDELNALANIFEQPFALKAMILNQNLPVLDSLFDKALFVWIKRDPIFNIQSALEARKRQFGDIGAWYSFKIREYPHLRTLDPLRSVAGQIYAINDSIEKGLTSVDPRKVLVVPYEEFCDQPATYHDMLLERLGMQARSTGTDDPYRGASRFRHTNRWRLTEYSREEVALAYHEASQARHEMT